MLKTLRLQNYRCFSDHTVSLHDVTIIVGKNNAGKSTIVEALHIIAAIVNRKAAPFVTPPSDLDIGLFHRCIKPQIAHLNLNLKTAIHQYRDPPAILTAKFEGGATVQAYVHSEGVHAIVQGPKGWITTSAQFVSLNIPYVHLLPQIGPLLPEETLLSDEHVDQHYYTKTGSRHFRNQIHRNPEEFDDFKRLAEDTWHGLRVDRIQRNGHDLALFVRDGDFTAEAAWMGHGLQMWLQTIWFVAKTPKHSIVILDEPDVYMHPDLQRRLYRLVNKRFKQCIIATHSVEIMAEADPSNILIINNKHKRSEYANNDPAVQNLIDHLGGIHNIHLARLWNAKRVIIVEGNDLSLLKIFHAILYPNSETPLDAIPNWSIGGWGGWAHAQGGSLAYKNAFGDRITGYCIFDSDYHPKEEQEARAQQAKQRGINLHIWQRKELENYVLNPTTIARFIKQRATKKKDKTPTTEQVKEQLDALCDEEKDTVLDGMSDALIAYDRKLTTGANKVARNLLNQRWKSDKTSMVAGKQLLAQLSAWAQKEWGCGIGASALARAHQPNEIPSELANVLAAIEEARPFTND